MSTIAPEPARMPPPPTAAGSGAQPVRRWRPWLVLVGGLVVVTAVAGIVLLPGGGKRVYRGIFTPTDPMTVARFWPSVTVLPDGRVLVAGGLDVTLKPIATAELYDPRTGTFSPTGSMATSRAARTTLLADGRVLVVGGRDADGRSIASTELYDPRTGTFSSTGSMTVARDWPGVALLADGRVLVAGGYADSQAAQRLIASAEVYDPRTGTFSPTGSMATARSAPAIVLADGRVLVAGGGKADGSSSAELYDPRTGTFSLTGSMTAPRGSPGVALLADGRVLVVGGLDETNGGRMSTAELYDPRTGTFSPTGSMATAREVPATLLADGRVLVAGGSEPNGNRIASAELYDPGTGTFSPTGSMTVPRYWPSLAILPDGRVLVVGFSASDGDDSRAASAELFE